MKSKSETKAAENLLQCKTAMKTKLDVENLG